MIHIFELTPSAGRPNPPPYLDWCRFLPKCDPGSKYVDANFTKETLKAEWAMGEDNFDETALAQNVETWRKIFKAIEKRVNDDMDDAEEIDVYTTVSTKNACLMACVVEARNVWLDSLVKDCVSQETLDTACRYSQIHVPVFTRERIDDDERRPRDGDRTHKWIFRRWVEI